MCNGKDGLIADTTYRPKNHYGQWGIFAAR